MDQNMTDTPIQENVPVDTDNNVETPVVEEVPTVEEAPVVEETPVEVTPVVETPVQPAPMQQAPVQGMQPQMEMKKEKEDKNGFGITSLVLGILSLCCFACCTNFITAIIAIIFGILQVVKYKKKGFAITGIILSIASILLSILLCIAAAFAASNGAFDKLDDPNYYNEIMQEIYGEDLWNEMQDELDDL